MIRWKVFQTRELPEAYAWADQGGYAVHLSGYKYRGYNTAHLLAKDIPSLLLAAEVLSIEARHLQHKPGSRYRPHFDIFGRPLARAIDLAIGELRTQYGIDEDRPEQSTSTPDPGHD